MTRWCGVERVGMTTGHMQVYSATLAIFFVEGPEPLCSADAYRIRDMLMRASCKI